MRRFIIAFVLVLAGSTAHAGNINNLPALSQSEFRALSEDLTAALSFKPLQPADTAGLTGFDLSLDASGTQVNDQAVWDKATSGSGVSTLPMARLRLNKGLPLGFDIGGFYSSAPGTNISLWGGELRYALLRGDTITPAVGIRAAYTRLSGVPDLGFNTRSLDISVSKGFGPVTPYFGVGRVWANSSPDAQTGLVSESIADNKVFGGLRFSLAVVVLGFEVDHTGSDNTYSAKVGFGF